MATNPTPTLASLQQQINTMQSQLQALTSKTGPRIVLNQNVDCSFANFKAPSTANSQAPVAHGLGRTPIGVIVTGQNGQGTIYKGSSAWNATSAFFESTVANTTYNLLFY
jgi:hypothetical protein